MILSIQRFKSSSVRESASLRVERMTVNYLVGVRVSRGTFNARGGMVDTSYLGCEFCRFKSCRVYLGMILEIFGLITRVRSRFDSCP